jgi:hypothetical protein
LEHFLSAAVSAYKPDLEIAHRLTSLELSERLTYTSSYRITKELTPQLATGSQRKQALQLLADQSGFLQPPPGELPVTTAPGCL